MMKRFLAVLVMVAVLATPLISMTEGAWERDPNLNEGGVFPVCKETVPLLIGIEQRATVEDWETNGQTLRLEELGNFDLSFEIYPSGEAAQKIELMVMAGGEDLPDVLMVSLDLATATKYGQAGMILPTNDYYANSAYWINESMKLVDMDCLKYVTSYDGNVYGIYSFMQSLNNEYSPSRVYIYEPWLEKLGLEMPQTTEEYLEVLRAFRDNDPNGNGVADEIPMATDKDKINSPYLRFMMSPFIYTQENYYMVDENGIIDVAFNKDGWREGLYYTRQLIDEGLLSPLSFTQDAAQLTAMMSPDPAVVGTMAAATTSFLGATDVKRVEYMIVPPLEGPTGIRQHTWSPSLPSIRMAITKNCKTPEAAFMLGDLLCSEELSIWSRWGEKDVDWITPEEGSKSVYDALGYEAIIGPISPWGVTQNKWWAQVGPFIVDARWPAGQVAANDLDHNIPIGKTIAPTIEYANRSPVVGLVFTEEEQEVISELRSTINTYVTESFARFVMRDMSLENDWDSYVAEFEKMGLSRYIEATQSAWTRMNTAD